MKIKLLPSTFDESGEAGPEQRLTCFLIDDAVAIDAGSLALGITESQRDSIRDIVITHPHADHIATLPVFIDDLFATLRSPVRVHGAREVIEVLNRDIFNWSVYPRFSELKNEFGPVLEYVPFSPGEEFRIGSLAFRAVRVNHQVPTYGLLISDGRATVAFSSDTDETEEFWREVRRTAHVDAIIVEASFPNRMAELAHSSKHLTPATLANELKKVDRKHADADILAVHLKPAFRAEVVEELLRLEIPKLRIMRPGTEYRW